MSVLIFAVQLSEQGWIVDMQSVLCRDLACINRVRLDCSMNCHDTHPFTIVLHSWTYEGMGVALLLKLTSSFTVCNEHITLPTSAL